MMSSSLYHCFASNCHTNPSQGNGTSHPPLRLIVQKLLIMLLHQLRLWLSAYWPAHLRIHQHWVPATMGLSEACLRSENGLVQLAWQDADAQLRCRSFKPEALGLLYAHSISP